MWLELKSILKNRIVRFVFVIGIVLAIYQTYQMECSLRQSGEDVYYGMQGNYTLSRDQLKKQTLSRDLSDPIQSNYVKYLEWLADWEYKQSQLYLQGIEKNRQQIGELDLLGLLTSVQLHCGPGDDLPTVVFRDELKAYGLADRLPFNLEQLGRFYYKQKEYNEAYSKPMFDTQMYQMRYYFTARKQGVHAPWGSRLSSASYLRYVYQLRTERIRLFLPVLIILAGYILIQAKKEKTFDLLAGRAVKKTRIFWHYFCLALMIAGALFILTEMLPVLYTGLRYGFGDLKLPMMVYEPGLHSAETFKSLQFSSHDVGLTHLRITAPSNHPDYPHLFVSLQPIPFWNFLVRSYFVEFLRLIFYVMIGTAFGCIGKRDRVTVPVVCGVFVFAAASGFWPYLEQRWNLFTIDSGWNVVMGWTQHSWWSAVGLLSMGILGIAVLGQLLIYRHSLR